MDFTRNFSRSKIWFYMLGVLSIVLVVLLVQTAFADGSDKDSKPNTKTENKEEGLQVNGHPKVNALIEKYFLASTHGNTGTLKEIIRPFTESDEAAAARKSEFVESYDNITCYTEDGVDEGTYVVFVYYDLKFPEVDTSVPGLETWIVSSDENGNLFINKDMESISEDMSTQIEELLKREDVVQLFESVDAKMQEALLADENLKALYEQMGGKSAEKEKLEEDDGTSQKTEATEAPVGQVEREMVAVVELEIFEKPSEDDSPIGKLSVGSFVWVDKNVEGGFSYVDKDGTVGYVKTSGLATYQPVDEEIKATINYYSSCDSDAPVMGTITSDKSYYCTLEYSNGWRQIIVNDTKVYIKKSDLDLEEEEEKTDATHEPAEDTASDENTDSGSAEETEEGSGETTEE